MLSASARDYFLSSADGDDLADGTSRRKAWRNLEKINETPLKPGDRVLFVTGSVWRGQLVSRAQGEPGQPVVYMPVGQGPRPHIQAAGLHEDAVLLLNPQHVELRGLEISNSGTNSAPRRGVHIRASNVGTLTNILIADLFIHDVNGTQKIKDNGGIIFRTEGDRTPTRFEGLRIERNIIWRVDRSGIAAQSHHARRTRWFPSLNVVIRDNWLGDLGGDGIVPWATDGVLVEHNIVQGANERAGTYNAGIWPWSTDNTIMRLNRASAVKTLMDGQGFDSDYNSRNTLIEYNLSHDNEGGFLLICTPGKRNPRENWGNRGTVARYNISRHDAARTFHVSAAEQTAIHHNAVYTAPGSEAQVMLLTDWDGWADGLIVSNNLFSSGGVARYGYQIDRKPNGAYVITNGWGPAKDVLFSGNRYIGKHEPAPSDTPAASAPKPVELDWPGPQFDPQHPETFPSFIKKHRQWMLRLMKNQFGHSPKI